MKRILLIGSLILVDVSTSYVFGSGLREENKTSTGKTKWLKRFETLTQKVERGEEMTTELYEELKRSKAMITALGLSHRTIEQVEKDEASLRARQRVIDLKFALLLGEERMLINLTTRLQQAESIRSRQRARDIIEGRVEGRARGRIEESYSEDDSKDYSEDY